jgi:hypothetical protein
MSNAPRSSEREDQKSVFLHPVSYSELLQQKGREMWGGGNIHIIQLQNCLPRKTYIRFSN